MDLTLFQKEVGEWAERNFPKEEPQHVVLGVCEEAGELAHAMLKEIQGIRGSAESHQAAARDAVGDIFIYAAHLCHLRGWNIEECLDTAWAEVKRRDWIKNNQTGQG